MTKARLPILALVCAAILGAASGFAAESPQQAGERQDLAQLDVLMRAGRYREAQTRYSQYEHGISAELLKQIRAAKNQKNIVRARDLYELYFALWPLGPQKSGAGDWEWTKHSRDFVQVLNTAAPQGTPIHRTRAATETRAYRSFVAFEKLRYDENKAYIQRAQQIAREFPRSIFALAALNASIASASTGDDDALILPLYRSGLQALQNGGAPARHQIILLSGLAGYGGAEESSAHNKIAYDAWRKIEALSDIEQEKAEALDQAAEAVRGFGTPDSLERSSALYAEVIRKYPNSGLAGSARLGIVNNLLSADQPDQALKTVRTFEKNSA